MGIKLQFEMLYRKTMFSCMYKHNITNNITPKKEVENTTSRGVILTSFEARGKVINAVSCDISP